VDVLNDPALAALALAETLPDRLSVSSDVALCFGQNEKLAEGFVYDGYCFWHNCLFSFASGAIQLHTLNRAAPFLPQPLNQRKA
jgi:hypothetical protein